ncbi:hypothetical protein [Flavihumibacter profundi]|uniref:hypothetical protein n=1 Tax=Flavihumibacter profundi TaxID=2716883 RepID=UPI001CC58F58|nr:hypothetical protein [Flavihumibacter profundi]MBZ5857753.1 hypothetical protein [Flavihumibacter profundi]
MSTDDWYRNTTWTREIETDFETRLKRSRGAYNKAQYLRIQASCLLGSRDKNIQSIGLHLMERLINDFSTEDFSTVFGHEQLGDYYFENKDFEKAETHFRVVTNHYKLRQSRSGTSGMAELKLADTILSSNNSGKFEEAYRLCKNYPINGLTFNSDKFYYAILLARLCNQMSKKDEAKEYAKAAIEISKITEPQFGRHKTAGLVNTTDKQLQTLEQIVNG